MKTRVCLQYFAHIVGKYSKSSSQVENQLAPLNYIFYVSPLNSLHVVLIPVAKLDEILFLFIQEMKWCCKK